MAGLAVFFLWQWVNGGESPGEAYRAAARKARTKQGPQQPAQEATAIAPLPKVKAKHERTPHRGSGGEIVLIIDDLGFDGQPLDRLMALDPNLNCSILPNGTRAAEFAKRLNDRGFEILCHLPMEPQGHETPGRNAIMTSMSDDEIERTTRENIEAIPHARGVNNHMGSRATSDRRVMTSVLKAIPGNMYFIDSRTAGGSIAGQVAREMSVPTATRNVFLDDVATERGVREQLDQLAAAAEKHGVAVAIGHPYPVTVRVLTEELPALRARGFRLVRASSVVR